MSDDGKLWYGIGADTTGLQQDIDKANGMFKGLSNNVKKEGEGMDNILQKVAMSIGVAFSSAQAFAFAKSIAEVRGEFQQLEVAFKTMLGSKAQSDKLMGELINTAATTPFELKDVAAGAKSLLAYGTAAADINKDLVMLGNVASGLSIPLNDLVYLYGTTQVQGRLYAQDMRQFMGRGIPVAEELAKQFGVSKEKVNDLVTAGKVGFPEIQKAFQAMTGEGGKFYNLMAEQSKTITGQISNLKDAVDMAMNEIGKSQEGAINTVLAGTKMVIENYEMIGKSIAGLIAIYGTYKAAVIVYNAVMKTQVAINAMIAASQGAMNTGLAIQYLWTEKVQKANAMLNKTMLANPYVLVATLLAGVAVAMWLMHDSTTAAEKAQAELNAEINKATELENAHRQEIDKLFEAATNQALADTDRAGALIRLKSLYPKIFAEYDIEKLKLSEILEIKQKIANQDAGEKIQSNKERVQDIDKQIADRQANIKRLKSQKTIDKGTADSITANEEDIKMLQSKKIKATQYVEADNVNQWSTGIKDMSDAKLQAEINYRERLKKALEGKGESAVAQVGSLGAFRADELKVQTELLEGELTRRKKVIINDKEYWEEQKKNAQDAQDLMGQDKIGSPEWKAQQALIDQADAKLKERQKKKTKDTTDSIKREEDEIAKATRDGIRRQEDLQMQADQSSIELMKDGAEKQLAQSEIEHRRKLTAIQRQKEDELIALQEVEDRKWRQAGGKGKKPTATLSQSSVQNYDELTNNENAAYKKKNEEIIQAKLADYMDYKQKVQKINDDFNTDEQFIINQQKNPGANQDALGRSLAQLKINRDKALKDVTESILKEAGLLEIYQGNGADFIKEKIEQVLPLFDDITKLTHADLVVLEKAIDNIDFTPEQLKAMEDAKIDIDAMREALEKFKAAAKGTAVQQDWENVLKIADKLAVSVGKLGDALSGVGGVVGEIGAGLSKASESVGTLTKLFDPKASKMDMAAAGIEGVVSLVTMITDQIAANKKAQEEWNAKIDETKHKLSLARIEAKAYQETNIFGVDDPYAKAISGMDQYSQALSELNAKSGALSNGQVQDGTKQVISGKNIGIGAGAGAAIGAALVGIFTFGIGIPLGAAIGAAVGAGVGAATTKTEPVFKSLKEKYGEIYNKDTFELNPAILADYDKLDEATKKMVDNWDEVKDKAKAAQEQMHQTFQDLAGSIGNDLSSALVDAFTNRDINGAIASFKDSVTDTIEQIIQKMIFAQYFQKTFDDLTKRMDDSFKEGGDQNIIDDIMWFTEEYPKQLEGYNATMTAVQDDLKKQGLDLFGMASRTGSNKGITTASQDTVDELNGRFTAVQGHTYNINETLKGMAANGAAMLNHLSDISGHTSRLQNIESTIGSVKTGIDQINNKGITIKV